MTARIEWRTRGKGEDALLYVGEYGEAGTTVLKTWDAEPSLIRDFLNDMDRLDTAIGLPESPLDKRSPQQWGDLVLARAQQGGDVLDIDPEIYWDKIYEWFRQRGTDPHPWRRE